MRIPNHTLSSVLFLLAASSAYAASWSFDDASVSIQSKKAGVGGSVKEKYVSILLLSSLDVSTDLHFRLAPYKPLSKPITLGPLDTLKVLLTVK